MYVYMYVHDILTESNGTKKRNKELETLSKQKKEVKKRHAHEKKSAKQNVIHTHTHTRTNDTKCTFLINVQLFHISIQGKRKHTVSRIE